MDHSELADMVFQLFLEKMELECASLCQQNADSLSPFRRISVDKLSSFQWKTFTHDLSVKAPILLRLLSFVIAHSDH